jgi:hypothetical protein
MGEITSSLAQDLDSRMGEAVSPVTDEQKCGLGGYTFTISSEGPEEETVRIGQKYYYQHGEFVALKYKIVAVDHKAEKAVIKCGAITAIISFDELKEGVKCQ